jgi:hypothetical protein
MQRSLNRFRDGGKPVDLVELAQQLLAAETAIDPMLARRIVGLALDREPQSLPDRLSPGDLRSDAEIESKSGRSESRSSRSSTASRPCCGHPGSCRARSLH